MKLRKLEEKDVQPMLEWMHDPFVVADLQTDFASKTEADCRAFIEAAATGKDVHLAIASDEDEYMGTVSLRNIRCGKAEFAITIRRTAMGRGYSSFAMKEILRIAFEERDLKTVYWCVDPKNARAVRFYEKNGYERSKAPAAAKKRYTAEEIARYYWFAVNRETEK